MYPLSLLLHIRNGFAAGRGYPLPLFPEVQKENRRENPMEQEQKILINRNWKFMHGDFPEAKNAGI